MTYSQVRQRMDRFADEVYAAVWRAVTGWFVQVGRLAFFFAEAVKSVVHRPSRFAELVAHMEFIGNRSVFIIVLTGTFAGLALSYQLYIGFSQFGATNLVGPTVAITVSRELGPVLTGLIITARAGGAMAARLGTMRVTEQIDALDVMGVDVIQYLVSPRLIAAVLCTPLLTAVFDFVAIVGAHWLATTLLGLDSAAFWDKISQWMNPVQINEGLLKAAVFGFFFSLICCYHGFNARGGARGVGDATNRGVVSSMVMIIVIDYYLAHLIRIYYRMAGLV